MILQGPGRQATILEELASLLSDPDVERLRVAVAYANVGGLRALQALVAARDNPIAVEVIVTLDMGITRKAALEYLLRDFEGDVRSITTGGGAGTFHAKAFVVDRAGVPARALVGSANLTHAALASNYEAVSVSELTPQDAEAWERWWADLVEAADVLTEEVVANYHELRPPPGRRERIADEDVETQADGSTVTRRDVVDAHAAEWLVIDWGGTGEYRVQAEFPRSAAAFFRGDTEVHRSVTIRYDGRDYRDNQLAYRADNGMWRIDLDGDLPVVADGSIKRETSLFTRIDDDHYELHLVDRTERAARLAEAASLGAVDHTNRNDGSRRQFGWAN